MAGVVVFLPKILKSFFFKCCLCLCRVFEESGMFLLYIMGPMWTAYWQNNDLLPYIIYVQAFCCCFHLLPPWWETRILGLYTKVIVAESLLLFYWNSASMGKFHNTDSQFLTLSNSGLEKWVLLFADAPTYLSFVKWACVCTACKGKLPISSLFSPKPLSTL